MAVSHTELPDGSMSPEPPAVLPFPPITKSHILNCSYHSWYSRYRSLTPKARLIPLSQPFLSYLCADGIRLPPEPTSPNGDPDLHSLGDDEDEDNDEDQSEDPSHAWQDINEKVKDTIAELNGSVMPKLNWSAPKDATWIAATNSMDCRTANDVYLLLKSSDFITHDLEQAFDDCVDDDDDDDDDDNSASKTSSEDSVQLDKTASKCTDLAKVPYHLILRKTIPNLNPSLEFRCFVRSRHLLCLCQRDLNHYPFLTPLIPRLRSLIQDFFDKNLQRTFPDENFVFDVYIPPPHNRVWLIDMNPWAPRTDPLLFSWLEILRMRGAEQNASLPTPETEHHFVRLSLNSATTTNIDQTAPLTPPTSVSSDSSDDDERPTDDALDTIFTPEFRLVNRDDPEACRFNSPQYSAHKLPKDVVDAGADGLSGLREFMGRWREIVRGQEADEREDEGGEGA